MAPAEIRKQLHQYIDNADDASIEAIYKILNPGMQASHLTEAELEEIHKRRSNYLAGNSQTYTVEEAHDYIRKQAKKQNDI